MESLEKVLENATSLDVEIRSLGKTYDGGVLVKRDDS